MSKNLKDVGKNIYKNCREKCESLKIKLQEIFKKYQKPFVKLGWRMVSTIVLTLTAVSTFVAYAAFTEPTAAPSASNQDFSQNILGADNGDNSFSSSNVTANNDGSVIERLEYLAGLLNLPSQADVKLTTAYGNENIGTLTPVNGATSALDATASDVLAGKVFFGSGDTDWTPTVGTLAIFGAYENQKNGIWDDWKGSASSQNNLASAWANNQDQNNEESTWETYTDSSLSGSLVATGEVKKDTRTGLYWSNCYDSTSGGNSCDTAENSFVLNGVVSDADDGLDAEGGVSVDFCESLSLDANGNGTDETDWYLPSQKELMQSYIDGSANNIPEAARSYWSSTENYNSTTYAWGVSLFIGYTGNYTKSSSYYARCVRR
ncbi:MAG: hypothetical protein ACD_7C00161G0011 [uncultured bacterium]|nr:MAG: hypothetical protein ACD_7C00161G0011 [uncultured bacterium]HBR79515.1 hypothetical protein [Candidatus Moranbacteria bacterium]